MFKKIIPFFPQIIISLFLAGAMVFAWTGPTGTPPGENAPAPLNVGPAEQTKQGGLIIDKGNLKIASSGAGIIFPDGTIQRTALTSGRQVFSVSGTFIVPTGVTKVFVTAVGGGAGGGGGGGTSCAAYCYSGGGGGGGGAGESNAREVSGLTSGSQIIVTVGAVGNGGAAGIDNWCYWCFGTSGSDGGAGGQSSFGSFAVSAGGSGGGGGQFAILSAPYQYPGSGGSIGGSSGSSVYGGAGGTSLYAGYGAGGNGGSASAGGGSGVSGGVVIVEW